MVTMPAFISSLTATRFFSARKVKAFGATGFQHGTYSKAIRRICMTTSPAMPGNPGKRIENEQQITSDGTLVQKVESLEKNASTSGAYLKLALCVVAIYACFAQYAIFKLNCYSGVYGVYNEPYTFRTFALVSETAANFAAASALLIPWDRKALLGKKSSASSIKQNVGSEMPLERYAGLLFTNTLAMIITFLSFREVSVPLLAIGKGCKILTGMLLAFLFGKRGFSMLEHALTTSFAVGVGFLTFQGVGGFGFTAWTTFTFALALFIDGLVMPIQKAIKGKFSPNPRVLTFWQFAFFFVWLSGFLVASNESHEAIGFLAKHPAALGPVAMFALFGGAAQNFIPLIVKNTSAAAFAAVNIVKKFFALFASVLLLQNAVLARKFVGLSLGLPALVLMSAKRREPSPKVATVKSE